MKVKFPEYKQHKKSLSDLQRIESEMSPKDKKVLEDFSEYCSTTAGKDKVTKIKRIFIPVLIVENPHHKPAEFLL